MRTLHPYPGKFEGNYSQAVAAAVYDRVCNGFSDETLGDIPDMGWIANLVTGKRYVFILVEDNAGFVDVEVFKIGDPAIVTNWAVYEKEAEAFYERSDSNA